MLIHTACVIVCVLGAIVSLGGALFAADALTPLGLLNFLVLQWFGVRLCKRTMAVRTCAFDENDIGLRLNFSTTAGGHSKRWRVVGATPDEVQLARLGVARWIWPLTGWWTDFRYIGRRP